MAVASSPQTSRATQLELPLTSWTEDTRLRNPNGGASLERWGSVALACRILGGCHRETMYHLIRAGAVKGYKLRGDVANSHYRIDLLSVWRYRNGQMAGGN